MKDVYDETKVRVGNYKPMNEWIKTTSNDEIWKDKLISFVQKSKSLNLVPRISDLGIVGLEFQNNIVIFEPSNLSKCNTL